MCNFIKREPVLCAALFLALVSSIIVQPSLVQIGKAIDWRVLSFLFCLMIIIQGFRSVNILDKAAVSVIRVCSNLRALYFAMTFLVFFTSMAVTNDVALLTFVPLTLIICKRANVKRGLVVKLVVFETLAANLGSCITPMGNPQNLFLYSFYTMTPASFFSQTIKIGFPSCILLSFFLFWETRPTRRGGEAEGNFSAREARTRYDIDPVRSIVYTVLLIFVLFAVFRVIDYKIALVVTVIVMLFCNVKLYAKVDYSLLFTFSGFFIFTSNISALPAVSSFLRTVQGTPLYAYLTGIVVSQVISNVPAALLLSKFSAFPAELLLAVNVGGLGTLIASLASVISYKLYMAEFRTAAQNEPAEVEKAVFEAVVPEGESAQASNVVDVSAGAKNGKKLKSYFAVFTIYNCIFLVLLGVIVWIL